MRRYTPSITGRAIALAALVLTVVVTINAACTPPASLTRLGQTGLTPVIPLLDRRDLAVVFIHGLGGDAEETWTFRKQGERDVHWPRLVRDHPLFKHHTNVYVYQYPSSLFGGSERMDVLTQRLHTSLAEQGVLAHAELVFVAHSLGGVILGEMLLRDHSLSTRVSMVFFAGTPSEGAKLATIARRLRDLTFVPVSDFVYDLGAAQPETTPLGRLLERWAASPYRWRSALYCAYETKPIAGSLIVDPLSATRLCNRPYIKISETHVGMVKPADSKHEIHRAFLDAFKARREGVATIFVIDSATRRTAVTEIVRVLSQPVLDGRLRVNASILETDSSIIDIIGFASPHLVVIHRRAFTPGGENFYPGEPCLESKSLALLQRIHSRSIGTQFLIYSQELSDQEHEQCKRELRQAVTAGTLAPSAPGRIRFYLLKPSSVLPGPAQETIEQKRRDDLRRMLLQEVGLSEDPEK